MIPLIIFFIGLFIFVNFFDYAKTFYDIIPGEIVGDVNFSTYPGAVYIFFIYLLFQYVRTKNLKYISTFSLICRAKLVSTGRPVSKSTFSAQLA